MDWLTDLRILITVVSFSAFVGIVLWAFAPALRTRFDADAAIPFHEDDPPSGPHAAQPARTSEK
ncbi:MAG: cbb3-type cytochrome oxidase subunit 3 [Betaproteobacteria bacterium]|nr:CcoQ/FixQ family Cbb3-type cytochrome c oxidase assembly chaperone [Betaproteobacteria bacterium]